MTFYEFGVENMFSKGMFENQAKEVMDIVVKRSENKDDTNYSMRERWNEDTSGYPEPMKAVICMAIEPIALEYIKKNIPEAWFRPMFDREHPLRKLLEEQNKKTIPEKPKAPEPRIITEGIFNKK